jgi:uncharacterized protein (UPF0218 family)
MQSKSDKLLFLKKAKKERLFYLRSNAKFKSLRKKLKKTLGMLIPLEHPYSTDYLKELISFLNPSQIITVGDKITFLAIERGIKPDLAIIDNKVEREDFIFEARKYFKKIIETENPPGMITNEAYEKIKTAIKDNGNLIEVKGEEDLLTLLAIKESKINALVIYGVPNLGISVVYCTKYKKDYVDKIFLRGR